MTEPFGLKHYLKSDGVGGRSKEKIKFQTFVAGSDRVKRSYKLRGQNDKDDIMPSCKRKTKKKYDNFESKRVHAPAVFGTRKKKTWKLAKQSTLY